MQVVRMKLATPAFGTLELSATSHPDLFEMAKVGLGALGVVTEVTLQCVDAHDLLEHTYTTTRAQLQKDHIRILKEHRHARFMWIPYTDTVVVVTNDYLPSSMLELGDEARRAQLPPPKYTPAEATAPMRDLLKEMYQIQHLKRIAPTAATALEESVDSMGFGALRDELLAIDPLNVDHIKRVNQAEADFWTRSESYDIGKNTNKLQFDCGGQQWVSEVAFPVGSLESPSHADFRYMQELLQMIEVKQIPAPAPIEQRWSSSSSSRMSPAATGGGGYTTMDDVHSWVGIIMYLPTDDATQRTDITEAFFNYKKECAGSLWGRYGAQEHWAKIEVPSKSKDCEALDSIQRRLKSRFPVETFNALRRQLDPNNVLANPHIDQLMNTE
mmetsp:Transcript_97535/g.278922  ORF Transcript_97535/g.278922 Transcript_97535/m.278922 type:complete len:385 (+) Transcript_97535:150-1304(+)